MQEEIYRRMYEVEDRHWWFSAKRRILRALLERHLPQGARAKARVADVGCGCGCTLLLLSGFCEAVGLDASEAAIDFCTKRGVDARLARLPDEVPLEAGTFDAVILSDVLEHIDDDSKAAAAAARLLRPGGIMIVTVPAYQALWSSWDQMHAHKRRYTKKTLGAALSSTGLDTIFISYYNTLLFPLALAERVARKALRSDTKAELAVPAAPVNWALERVFAAERHLLGRVPLPAGLSLAAVLRKR